MSPCTSSAARLELPSERGDGRVVRCPQCGAPAHKRIRPAEGTEDLVFALPTDASDAMVDIMVRKLTGWGLQADPSAVAAVRDGLHSALVILAQEIDYRWK